MLSATTRATVLALFPLLPQGSDETPPVPYVTLTNTSRSVGNLNVETVRGLAYDAPQDRLYAINTHGSTLMAFDGTPPAGLTQPLVEWRTLNNPVALALWDDGSGGKFALVVGGGTHGLVKQDRMTGEIVGYLELKSEPMDIVIDTERNMAFVSCAGAFDKLVTGLPLPDHTRPFSGGVVIQIDLSTFAFSGGSPAGTGRHWIDSMRPSFLNIEMGDAGTSDNFVYVAPLLSSNRTTFTFTSFDDATVVSAPQLPDDDLFRIDHLGAVTPVVKGAGTLLTAHGQNPSTDEYWILNVESRNAAEHTEAAHRGRFAENRVTRMTVPPTGAFTLAGIDSLDGAAPVASPSSANKPASFPFGLAFDAEGHAFVTGSTGDDLRVLDSAGVSVRSVGLPQGSIPRSVLLSPSGSTLFVYLWGTNRVLAFDAAALVSDVTAPPITPLAEFDLGADPLPEAVKNGRAIWYDADNSNDAFASPAVPGKVSCNTCHPRGGLDGLGWDLTGPPLDRKDTMVTQSLLSIEDTFPYHWRGERSLSDFNGAFHDLLGGQVLDSEDLADFEAFVFSLQAPANPRQSVDRMVDDAQALAYLNGGAGSAIQGQNVFHTTPDSLAPFFPATCLDCHGAEGGSNGLITPDIITAIPSNSHADVTHLRQLHHKFFQPLTDLGGGNMRPRSGFGFTQDGNDNDILDFLQPAVFFSLAGSLQDTLRRNAASFVAQFDQGIAPRAHSAFLFDQMHGSLTDLNQMITEDHAGWIDVVAVGHTLSGGVPAIPLGLWYDTTTQLFWTAEVGVGLSISAAALDVLRQANGVRFLIVGLPPGNGFRFAVDPDDDEMSNTAEILFMGAHGGTLNLRRRDSDGDELPDGYEADHFPGLNPTVSNPPGTAGTVDTVPPALDPLRPDVLDFVSGRVSKHFVAFTEPVTYQVQLLRANQPTGPFSPIGPVQHHSAVRSFDTLLAHGLVPSIDAYGQLDRDDFYRLQVTLTDLAGNANPVTIPSNPTVTVQSDDLVETNAPLFQALIVSDIVVQSHSGNDAVINIDVDDIWQGATPFLTFADNKIAVLQLVAETAPGSGEFAVPAGVVLTTPPPPSKSSVQTTVTIQDTNPPFFSVTYGLPGSQMLGPFLLAEATHPVNGKAKLEFSASGIAAGTKVRVVVLGLFELNPGLTTFRVFSERFWQMPMTETDNRSVEFTW